MQDNTTKPTRPNWLRRRVEKCLCGHRACKDWHVSPEAALQGVKFTKDQATQVAILLDMIDRESGNPNASSTASEDVLIQLTDALSDNLSARDMELFAPNTIVVVRADLLSVACLEIESLRKQLGNSKVLAAGIEGFHTREGTQK